MIESQIGNIATKHVENFENECIILEYLEFLLMQIVWWNIQK